MITSSGQQQKDMRVEIHKYLSIFTLTGKALKEFIVEWQTKTKIVQLNQYIYHPRIWRPYFHDQTARKYWEAFLEKNKEKPLDLKGFLEQFSFFKEQHGVKLTKNQYHALNSILNYNTMDYDTILPFFPKKIKKKTFQKLTNDLLQRMLIIKTPYLQMERLNLIVVYVFFELWEHDNTVLKRIEMKTPLLASYTLNEFNTRFLLLFTVPKGQVDSFIRKLKRQTESAPVKEIRFYRDDFTRNQHHQQIYNFYSYNYKQRKWDKALLKQLSQLPVVHKNILDRKPGIKAIQGANKTPCKLNQDMIRLLNVLLQYPNAPNKVLRKELGWSRTYFITIHEAIRKCKVFMYRYHPNLEAFNLELLVMYGDNFRDRIKNLGPFLKQPFTLITPLINHETQKKGELLFVASLKEILQNLRLIVNSSYTQGSQEFFCELARYKPLQWRIPLEYFQD